MSITPEEEELGRQIRKWAEEYAKDNGFAINPDEKTINIVIRGLARNRINNGEQYCPCRIRSGDPEKDAQIICPCIFHKDEIEKDGICHCRLFVDPGRIG